MSQTDRKHSVATKTLWFRRAIYMTLSLAFLLVIAAPRIANAESTNQNEVRAKLAEGGWFVVYGDRINEADYALFIAAVASSVACECPAPIYKYFDYQLQQQLTKIRKTAPDIAQDALEDLLIRAFDSNGQVLRQGRLEISGGLATYKRWNIMIYDEPRTYKCKQDLPFPPGAWTWSECITVERVEKRDWLPENYQPYFRFRWTSAPSPTPGSYGSIHFLNKCSRPIYTAIRYKTLNDEWTTDGWWLLDPGEDNFVAKTKNSIFYTYAESKDPASSRLYWSGEDTYSTVGEDSETYGFKQQKITSTSWGTWTQSFSCN